MSNKSNNKKQKNPNRFRLGHNTGTILIIAGVIVFIFLALILIGTKVNYHKEYEAHKVTPFSEKYPDAKTLKRYDEFKVDLYCTSFSSKDEHKATFKLMLTEIEDHADDLLPITTSLTVNTNNTSSNPTLIVAEVCLAANWVDVEKYSSTLTFTKEQLQDSESSEFNKRTKEFTISLDKNQVFPMKKNMWPKDITVKAPDAYLFLAYYTVDNGVNTLNKYIVKYTYDQYTSNDFNNFGITSPAI